MYFYFSNLRVKKVKFQLTFLYYGALGATVANPVKEPQTIKIPITPLWLTRAKPSSTSSSLSNVLSKICKIFLSVCRFYDIILDNNNINNNFPRRITLKIDVIF